MYKKIIFLLIILLFVNIFLIKFFWQKKEEHLSLQEISFQNLPEWNNYQNYRESLRAFIDSCKIFLQQKDKIITTKLLTTNTNSWHKICRNAIKLNQDQEQDSNGNTENIKLFFEKNFTPFAIINDNNHNQLVSGLFTGYYTPLLIGNSVQTAEFNVPLYSKPNNLIAVNLANFPALHINKKIFGMLDANNNLLPYYDRNAINNGAINNYAKVLAWIRDPIEAINAEIEGAVIIKLMDRDQENSLLYLGYDGENGLPYVSIVKIMIEKHIFNKDNASMKAIRKYFINHPEKINSLLGINRSFVFFKKAGTNISLSAQGLALNDGYSLAVDPSWIPLGVPLWLSTTIPTNKTLNRMMIAQDTGGAIKGPVRGDIYFGADHHAEVLASQMKNQGHYWILLPKKFDND